MLDKLVSGMVLEDKYRDLHVVIYTPHGLKVVDNDGYVISLRLENYCRAWIPVDYFRHIYDPVGGILCLE